MAKVNFFLPSLSLIKLKKCYAMVNCFEKILYFMLRVLYFGSVIVLSFYDLLFLASGLK